MVDKTISFIKFGALGVVINLLGLATFFVFVSILRLSPDLSVFILSPCFLLLTYYSQKFLIFKSNQATIKVLPLFLRNHLLVYVLNVVGVFIFCDILKFDPLLVQILHLCFLGALSFFLSERIFR